MTDESETTKKKSRGAWKVRLFVYGGLLVALLSFGIYCTAMPGSTAERFSVADVDPDTSARLRATVERLVSIGPRNLHHTQAYVRAKRWLEGSLTDVTGRSPTLEEVKAPQVTAYNIYSEWGPSDSESLLVVGAHYDTAFDTPGGNDNGSGVAVGLELAARLQRKAPDGRVRIVFFANEEPPYFWTDHMGSLVHAQGCKERGEEIRAMISLETLGFYSKNEGSQEYPPPVGLLYPSKGNFVAFVGNLQSRGLVIDALGVFRESVEFPSEGGAFPASIPGIGWSDHWAFWQMGYPAIMVTDTAPFRDKHYHRESDRLDHIDFGRLAVVTDGLEAVIRRLAAD